jgi:hypothetical protein
MRWISWVSTIRPPRRDKARVTIFARAICGFPPVRSVKPLAALVPIQQRLVRPRIDYPLCGAAELVAWLLPARDRSLTGQWGSMLRYVTRPGTTTELVVLQVILAAIWLASLHFHWFK